MRRTAAGCGPTSWTNCLKARPEFDAGLPPQIDGQLVVDVFLFARLRPFDPTEASQNAALQSFVDAIPVRTLEVCGRR